MNRQSFSLKPFPSGRQPDLEITGNLGRFYNNLSISYTLSGQVEIAIPGPADFPFRKDRLWEETCFELFLCPKKMDNYWEFNLSPAGYWNVYSFTFYRQDMREEPAFQSLPFSVHLGKKALQLFLTFNMDKIIPAQQVLNVAVSAVIKTIDGSITYWALSHPGPKPDFHRRDSFIIEL